jgi:hypothetical protein
MILGGRREDVFFMHGLEKELLDDFSALSQFSDAGRERAAIAHDGTNGSARMRFIS